MASGLQSISIVSTGFFPLSVLPDPLKGTVGFCSG
jgi:hypothetical protein